MVPRDSVRSFFRRQTKYDPEGKDRPDRASKYATPIPQTADFSLKSCALDDCPPIGVRYWPAYTNPYQRLFYGFASERFAAHPGDAATALADTAKQSGRLTCFHVHWLNFLFREAERSGQGNAVFEYFLDSCGAIRDRGGVIAWTIHNTLEHETTDANFEVAFRRRLARIADVIVVHGEQGEALAAAEFNADPRRIINVAHGSYIGVYADDISREVARSRVQAPTRRTIFANIGAMRPYKGLEELIAAVTRIEQTGASVGLILAGAAVSPEYAEALATSSAASSAIRLDFGRIEDDDIQAYLNAADFMVLPYRSILTSGSAILGLSFARPIIAPSLGGLGELIEDGVSGFLYDPASSSGLETALIRASSTDAETRARMSRAAYAQATALRWSEGRNAFIQAILDRARTPARSPSS